MSENDINYFFIFVIVIIIVLINVYITNQGLKTWYFTDQVEKSQFSPPPIVFGIVWTILYVLYAWTWCLAYKKSGYKYYPLFIWSIILNLLWVVFFFGFQNMVLSRITIILLLITVLYQAYIMNKLKSNLGTVFMLLYALWLVCAAVLNFTTTIPG